MPAWQALLDWWFGYLAEQDAEARERFAELSAQALAGELQDWAEQADGWLALLLLLDQLPRMVQRGTAQAFAGDDRAQQLVHGGLAQGFERQLAPIRQVFIYMVLEHAEDLPLQNQAVERFSALREQVPSGERELFSGYLDFALRHQRVIRRFGRFPHRNAILGRVSTLAEVSFLREPGSRF